MNSARASSNRGFTLIEVMITVAIIAILASIALPAYNGYITRSQMKAAQADLISLSLGLENRFQRQLAYPTATTTTSSDTQTEVGGNWQPSQSVFTYTLTSTATGYTVVATGAGGKVSGCAISLTDKNVRTTTGCPYGGGSWL